MPPAPRQGPESNPVKPNGHPSQASVTRFVHLSRRGNTITVDCRETWCRKLSQQLPSWAPIEAPAFAADFPARAVKVKTMPRVV
jgi:hypothetical protein